MEEEQNQPKEGVLKKLKNKTVPTRLGLLIILLVAVANGAVVLWYMNSYTPPEAFDVSGLVGQMQERREVKKELPEEYEIKADGVYYERRLIEEADSGTFEYLGNYYAKDSQSFYWGSALIEGADAETFTVIENWYAKDAQEVYWKGDSLSCNVDPDTFEILFIQDEWMEEVGYYARDYRFVIHSFTYGAMRYIENNCIIKDVIANPETFEYVGGFFSKDAKYVYYGNEDKIIPDADPETFEYVSIFNAKDAMYVYKVNLIDDGGRQGYGRYEVVIVEGVDPTNCTTENLEGCEAPTE